MSGTPEYVPYHALELAEFIAREMKHIAPGALVSGRAQSGSTLIHGTFDLRELAKAVIEKINSSR